MRIEMLKFCGFARMRRDRERIVTRVWHGICK